MGKENKLLKFYLFRQNKSGGFDEDENIAPYVIIQAYSAEQANALSSMFGIYFNGVENDRDCDCCGDRWYEVDEDDEIRVDKSFYPLIDTTVIHYIDGEIQKIYASWTKKIESYDEFISSLSKLDK